MAEDKLQPPSYNESPTQYTNKKLLIDFLDRYGIQWFPIHLEFIPKGKDNYGYDKYEKQLKDIYHDLYKGITNNGYSTNKPLPTDFVKRPEIVEARKEAWRNGDIKCNAIWIETKTQHQIDQDAPTIHEYYQNFLEGIPYYKSSTKEYGKHYFPNVCPLKFRGNKQEYTFKKFNDNNELIDESNEKLEYLCGKPSYALIDAEIHNPDYEYTLDNEFIIEPALYNCKSSQNHQSIESFDINENIEQNVSDILNEIFEEDISWNIQKDNDRFTILPEDDIPCLVDRSHTHNNQRKHCIIYASSRCVTATCLSHGSKRFYKKEYPLVEDLKESLGLKLSKDKKKELFQDVEVDEEIEVDDSILEKMLYNTTTTHESVAKLFKYFFPNDFVCTDDDKTREWFQYENGTWTKSGSSTLRKFISEKFVIIMKNYCKRAKEKEESTETSREQIDYYKNLQDVLKQIIMKCETTGYTDSLIKQLISKYINREFYEKLDTNEYLLCFGNDVYDLKINEWRESRQEDMMSLKCNMVKDDIKDDHVDEMMSIIDSIFTDEGRKNYFLDTLARDILCGNNKKHNFHLWTGIGGNGKGVISSYIKHILGDYYQQFDASMLTQKRNGAENANPRLAELKGKRCAMFTEPEKKSKLNIGLMNYLSGEADMSVRQLFKNLSTLKITFTCFIQCNNSFKMEDIEDNSIQRRLSFLKFTTKFTDNPKRSYERKGDSNVNSPERLEKLKGAFMFILLERWKIISKNKNLDIHIPQCIKEDKEEFINDNDLIHTFIESNIEITDNKKDYLQVNRILEKYYDWVEQENEQTDKYTTGVFINRLMQYLPEFKKRHMVYTEEGKRSEKRNSFINCKFIDTI
jgi:P4 family phage/plasmid primase-like protien